ncbi:hypothetical protein C8Q78DRAFT_1015246, partial [Trametes maxima]
MGGWDGRGTSPAMLFVHVRRGGRRSQPLGVRANRLRPTWNKRAKSRPSSVRDLSYVIPVSPCPFGLPTALVRFRPSAFSPSPRPGLGVCQAALPLCARRLTRLSHSSHREPQHTRLNAERPVRRTSGCDGWRTSGLLISPLPHQQRWIMALCSNRPARTRRDAPGPAAQNRRALFAPRWRSIRGNQLDRGRGDDWLGLTWDAGQRARGEAGVDEREARTGGEEGKGSRARAGCRQGSRTARITSWITVVDRTGGLGENVARVNLIVL